MKSIFVIGVIFAAGVNSSSLMQAGKALIHEMHSLHTESMNLLQEITGVAGLEGPVSQAVAVLTPFTEVFAALAERNDVFNVPAQSKRVLDGAAMLCYSAGAALDVIAKSPRVGEFKPRVGQLTGHWKKLAIRAAAPLTDSVAPKLSEEASVKVEQLLHDVYSQHLQSEMFLYQIHDTLKAHGTDASHSVADGPVTLASRVFAQFQASYDQFPDSADPIARGSVVELVHILASVEQGCTCLMNALTHMMDHLEGTPIQESVGRVITSWRTLKVRTSVIIATMKRDFGLKLNPFVQQCVWPPTVQVFRGSASETITAVQDVSGETRNSSEPGHQMDGGLISTENQVQAPAAKKKKNKKKSHKKRNVKDERNTARKVEDDGQESNGDDDDESPKAVVMEEPTSTTTTNLAPSVPGARRRAKKQRKRGPKMAQRAASQLSDESISAIREGDMGVFVNSTPVDVVQQRAALENAHEENRMQDMAEQREEREQLPLSNALTLHEYIDSSNQDALPLIVQDNVDSRIGDSVAELEAEIPASLINESSDSSELSKTQVLDSPTPHIEDYGMSQETAVVKRSKPRGNARKWRRPHYNPHVPPQPGVLMPPAMVPFTLQLLELSQQMGILADQMRQAIQMGYMTAPFPEALGIINHYETQFGATYRSIQYLQHVTVSLSHYANSLPPIVVPPPTQSWTPYNL